jgi:hypothetical protein
MNKYRAGDDRQMFVESWGGGNPFNRKLVSGPVHVPDCFLCVFGTMQPEVAHELLGEATEDGLNARFGLSVVLPSTPPVWTDEEVDQETVSAYTRAMRKLREVPPQTIKFSQEAGEVFQQWYIELMQRPEVTEGCPFGFHIAKYPSLFARLALIFHFLDHGTGAPSAPKEVSKDVARRVQRFIDEYLEPHARRLYGLLGAHVLRPGAVKIAQWLQKDGVEVFTAREVRRKGWKEFRREDDRALIDSTLDYLEAHDWIEIREKAPSCKGGRPTRVAIVNPRVHQGSLGRGRPARAA